MAVQNSKEPLAPGCCPLLSQMDLARRWGRSESEIVLASAVGAGPLFVKINGMLNYPLDEVRKYEQACLPVTARAVNG